MRLRTAFSTICLVGVAVAAQAGQFDGLYAPTGMQWSCNPNDVGMDGGALQIDGTSLIGVENFCRLAQPTPIRDMDAVLYDATCDAEGMEYRFRVMLLAKPGGVYVINDTGVADWSRCR